MTLKDLVNFQDSHEETPLHKAIQNENIYLIEMLLNIDKIIFDINDNQNVTVMVLLAYICKDMEAWIWFLSMTNYLRLFLFAAFFPSYRPFFFTYFLTLFTPPSFFLPSSFNQKSFTRNCWPQWTSEQPRRQKVRLSEKILVPKALIIINIL